MFYTLATRPSTFDTAAAHLASRVRTPFAQDSQRENDPRTERSFEKVVNPFFSGVRTPVTQMKDTENGYEVQLDVPGVAREHLDIGIEGDVVRVTSKEGAARPVKAAWRFPLEIDATGSKAKLAHGVLSLQLAKKVPVSNVTQLAIE